MALDANAYGKVVGVAGNTPRYANNAGDFDDSTRPDKPQVERWMNQVSSRINAKLAELGFAIPITDATMLPMFDGFVEQEVAALAEGVNGSGKFGPTALRKAKRGGRWNLLGDDINAFLEDVAPGLEREGATRTYSAVEGVGYRDTDEAGDDTFPLRQRKEFHDQKYQIDWDQD